MTQDQNQQERVIELKDLPFDTKKYWEFYKNFITLKQSQDALTRQYFAAQKKCSLFFEMLYIGLIAGSGCMICKVDGKPVPYLVTTVDAMNFEIVTTRYDFWKDEDRTVYLIDRILKNHIASVDGFTGSKSFIK